MGLGLSMKRCSVCSIRPSPPSATITSAVSGGQSPYRAMRLARAAFASAAPEERKQIACAPGALVLRAGIVKSFPWAGTGAEGGGIKSPRGGPHFVPGLKDFREIGANSWSSNPYGRFDTSCRRSLLSRAEQESQLFQPHNSQPAAPRK